MGVGEDGLEVGRGGGVVVDAGGVEGEGDGAVEVEPEAEGAEEAVLDGDGLQCDVGAPPRDVWLVGPR